MKTQSTSSPGESFFSTGIAWLDNILGGDLKLGRICQIEGEQGTGKTTAGLQLLVEGASRGESVVYVMLAENAAELIDVADSQIWNMEGVHIQELLSVENLLQPEAQHTIFHPSEVEMGSTTQIISAAIEEREPTRVLIDSNSELQLLADRPLCFRPQVFAFKQLLAARPAL